MRPSKQMSKLAPFKKFREDMLEDDTDYLFCPVCRTHVPCRRLATGGWEVMCPGCAGECGFCGCHLRRFCFGSREQFPPFPANEEK